jgi:coenzyme F420-0:L-glutamate ligase / coenzyme F420-1:gamma-L-glutamate ligase
MRLTPNASRFIRATRIAHLATADANGEPHVIPICFIFDGKNLYSPIDEKPKRNSPLKLKRIRNISVNPRVAVIVDRYDENWQRLFYVLIAGRARLLLGGQNHRKAARLLRRKYPQYRTMAIDKRPMIAITPTHARSWGHL